MGTWQFSQNFTCRFSSISTVCCFRAGFHCEFHRVWHISVMWSVAEIPAPHQLRVSRFQRVSRPDRSVFRWFFVRVFSFKTTRVFFFIMSYDFRSETANRISTGEKFALRDPTSRGTRILSTKRRFHFSTAYEKNPHGQKTKATPETCSCCLKIEKFWPLQNRRNHRVQVFLLLFFFQCSAAITTFFFHN